MRFSQCSFPYFAHTRSKVRGSFQHRSQDTMFLAGRPALQSSLLGHHCWPILQSFLSVGLCHSFWLNNRFQPLYEHQLFGCKILWACVSAQDITLRMYHASVDCGSYEQTSCLRIHWFGTRWISWGKIPEECISVKELKVHLLKKKKKSNLSCS